MVILFFDFLYSCRFSAKYAVNFDLLCNVMYYMMYICTGHVFEYAYCTSHVVSVHRKAGLNAVTKFTILRGITVAFVSITKLTMLITSYLTLTLNTKL